MTEKQWSRPVFITNTEHLHMFLTKIKKVPPVLLLILGICIATYHPGYAQQHQPDLTELTLEELMNIEITSVSKKKQKLSEAAAAIYVITQEDIQRSGATSIPQALRMVPGLHVARIDANKWAITARGFNGRFANKLLVLIDGRSVYTHLFSGVFWEVKDTILDDIERIEVIRGPGATLWGANAVNGVINIITKRADKTQGGLVTLGRGTEEKQFGQFRYGSKFNDDAHFRFYGKYFERDEFVTSREDFVTSMPRGAHDDWKMLRGGFRIDWEASAKNSLTLQGDIYDGEIDQLLILPVLTSPFGRQNFETVQVSGGNVLARWHYDISELANLSLQAYYDRTKRSEITTHEDRQTVDIEIENRVGLGRRQELIWGAGFRYIIDDAENRPNTTFTPEDRKNSLSTAFILDEMTLIENKLRFMIGSKFENNDFTGFEIQPNARLLWQPNSRQTFWGTISRAVRTPARAERDIRIDLQAVPPADPSNPQSLPTLLTVQGDSEFDSEDLIAYEAGYRAFPTRKLSLDVATFYTCYSNLRSTPVGNISIKNTPVPHVNVPIVLSNNFEGQTYGVELAADWRISEKWDVSLVYANLQTRLQTSSLTDTLFIKALEKGNPQNQVFVKSNFKLNPKLEFGFGFQYMDQLKSVTIGRTFKIDDYVDMDIRLNWKPTQNMDISIIGQNLLEDHHLEFVQEFTASPVTEIERGVYGKFSFRF